MKRLLIALLLLLAASSIALPQQRRARNRGRRAAAERRAPARDTQGVTIRENTVHVNSDWAIVQGPNGTMYAKKKAASYVLAIKCKCSLESGYCFAQSRDNNSIECRGSTTCAGGTCSMVTEWVTPKKIDNVGLPGGN